MIVMSSTLHALLPFVIISFLAVTSVQGQSPTSVPSCAAICLTTAATSVGCSSASDGNCLCSHPAFKTSALSCINASCSGADTQSAQGALDALCQSISGSTTNTVPVSTTSSTLPPTSTAPGSSQSSTSPSSLTSISSAPVSTPQTSPSVSSTSSSSLSSPGSSNQSGDAGQGFAPPVIGLFMTTIIPLVLCGLAAGGMVL